MTSLQNITKFKSQFLYYKNMELTINIILNYLEGQIIKQINHLEMQNQHKTETNL